MCCLFTVEEEKVRNRWLTWCILIPIILLVISYIYYAILSLKGDIQLTEICLRSFYFIYLLTAIWFSYYCSYKKYGKNMLSLSLTLTPIFWGRRIYFLFSQVVLFDLPPIYWIFLAAEICYSIWGYFLSFKLLKVNKKFINLKKEKIDLYHPIFNSICVIDELDKKYKKLINENSSSSDQFFINECYQIRKNKLTRALSVLGRR